MKKQRKKKEVERLWKIRREGLFVDYKKVRERLGL